MKRTRGQTQPQSENITSYTVLGKYYIFLS